MVKLLKTNVSYWHQQEIILNHSEAKNANGGMSYQALLEIMLFTMNIMFPEHYCHGYNHP